jgi:hypothetical protein
MAMKVFVAAATGAVGKRLVPMLVASGYDVTDSTRSAEKAGWLSSVGAKSAVVDALDRNAVMQAVVRAEPDVVVHELTGPVAAKSFKNRPGRDPGNQRGRRHVTADDGAGRDDGAVADRHPADHNRADLIGGTAHAADRRKMRATYQGSGRRPHQLHGLRARPPVSALHPAEFCRCPTAVTAARP